ncbi:MAG: hypothetical protein ACRDSQ_23000 [Actinokineospora sp.]
MTQPILLVRLRPGPGIGERRRGVHLVSAPDSVPEHLTAWCGMRIAAGTADLLPDFSGMPCELCLAKASRRTLPTEG